MTSPKATTKRLARIEVSADGFYEITYAALANAKVTQADLSEVPITQLAIENQGAPVGIELTDADQDGKFTQGDSIRFYGVKLRKELPADQPACPGYSEARPNHFYAEANVYWLIQSDEAARILQIDSTIPPTSTVAAPTYRLTRHFEEDERYWQAMPGQQCDDRWFWQRRLSSTSSITLGITTTHSYPLTLGNLPVDQSRPLPTLVMNLRGYAGATHPFTLAYAKADATLVPISNGEIRRPEWREQSATLIPMTIPYADLQQMKELIIEARPGADPTTGSRETINQFLVNWFEVDLEESYRAVEPTIFLFGKSTMAAELIELHGLDTSNVEIYDVTNPAQPEQISNLERLPTGEVRFQSRRGHAERITCQGNRYLGRCYLAITRQAYLTPTQITSYQAPNQSLASRSRSAEYVIITAEPFVGAATELADHRQSSAGLNSAVVTVSQIYDEFNDGIPNPRAIRDFLEYAYHCWNDMGDQGRLSYVVLMGDANQDYKNHLGLGHDNYVPSFSFESTLFGEVSSDNWFASIATNLDDVIATDNAATEDRLTRLVDWCDDPHSIIAGRDALPDLFIGRIPVIVDDRDPRDKTARQYVAKIINYERISFDTPWTRDIYFIADDEPKFATSAKELQSTIGGLYNSTIMTISNSTSDDAIGGQSPDVKALEIVENFHQGKLLVGYIGHGDYDAWGLWDATRRESDYIFHKAYLERTQNNERLPLVTVGNCLNGFFAGPTPNASFAEAFLFDPDGGAIAVWAPTGLGLPSGHRILLSSFYKTLFLTNSFNSKYDPRAIGVAAQSAAVQTYVANNYWQELVWTYVMFGDPALRMPVVSGTYLPIIVSK